MPPLRGRSLRHALQLSAGVLRASPGLERVAQRYLPDLRQSHIVGDSTTEEFMGPVAFGLASGKIAIGDPGMGLVVAKVDRAPGRYRLQRGALVAPSRRQRGLSPVMTLDLPCLFVLDAAHKRAFLAWFERIWAECRYDMARVGQRASEIPSELGCEVAFYWESELAGVAKEGSYRLDPKYVHPAA